MNKNLAVPILLLTTGCVACGGGTTAENTARHAPTTATTTSYATPATRSLQLPGDPKSAIANQFELLKAGETEKLKACFTEWLRERITTELVENGKSVAARYTLDDLVASVETGESDGKKTAKIKMKNGRTLTTLIETDGRWLADTIWFK